MDIFEHNRKAWNREVARGCRWTRPVESKDIAAARRGEAHIVLTPSRAIPDAWFPPMEECKVLALASGGGQQGPLLAARGAEVVVFDQSEDQLGQDRGVAEREGLELRTERGDMRDLSRFADHSFDLIVHPASNTFIPDVNPVWRECHRVLRPGGSLLAGFCNPLLWIFDDEAAETRHELIARHSIPYSDIDSLDEQELQKLIDDESPLCFGHSLEDLLGGQIEAGFAIIGFYEDRQGTHPLDPLIASMIATRATRAG